MKKRYLVFAFDKNCDISLILHQDEIESLDKFTSSFNNSNEIRNEYSNQINEFINKNKNYIITSEETSGRKETGDIVLLEINQNKYLEKENKRVKVIYKYHILLFEELVKDKELMKFFARKSYYEIKNSVTKEDSKILQLSEYDSKVLCFYENQNKREYNKVLQKWKEQLGNSNKYYSTIREIFKLYKETYSMRKKYGNDKLLSFETLENKYKNMLLIKKSRVYRKTISSKVNLNDKDLEKMSFDALFFKTSYDEELEDLLHDTNYFDPNMNSSEFNDFYDYASDSVYKKSK